MRPSISSLARGRKRFLCGLKMTLRGIPVTGHEIRDRERARKWNWTAGGEPSWSVSINCTVGLCVCLRCFWDDLEMIETWDYSLDWKCLPPLSLYYWKSVSGCNNIGIQRRKRVFHDLEIEILSYLYFFIIGKLLIKFESVSDGDNFGDNTRT